MEEKLKNLEGSESRDKFKYDHKQLLPYNFYARDIDFILISPNGILAILDYKKNRDNITWTEQIAYNDFKNKGYKVYIAKGENLQLAKVFEYISKDKLKLISNDFITWEHNLRNIQKLKI